MKKKLYDQPTMKVILLKHRTHLLVGSDNYGVNRSLQGTSNPNDEVDEAW